MNLHDQSGRSLLEVIMAMIILAMVVIGLNASLMVMVNSNVSAKEISMATAQGNAVLEKLRVTDYNSIVTSSDVVNSKFVRSWLVTDDGSKKKVDVTVAWPLSSANHAIELSTIIARP